MTRGIGVGFEQGIRKQLVSPEEAAACPYTDTERATVEALRRKAFVFGDQVAARLTELAHRLRLDELVIVTWLRPSSTSSFLRAACRSFQSRQSVTRCMFHATSWARESYGEEICRYDLGNEASVATTPAVELVQALREGAVRAIDLFDEAEERHRRFGVNVKL
jgi:hypothetical protein